MAEQPKQNPGRLMMAGAGIVVVGILDVLGVIPGTGSGVSGAVHAGLFYGIGGAGGGMILYEIIQHLRK